MNAEVRAVTEPGATRPQRFRWGMREVSGAQSARPQRVEDADLFLVLLLAAIGVTLNSAVAFAAGVPMAYALWRSGAQSPRPTTSSSSGRKPEASSLRTTVRSWLET
ncbi:hypothetical protein ACQVP2_15250 [Methylobacterium aquaticum]|uniref:hypothetical protein n=1 Tax=Methylobacterium aquaticum TaxID=270351 RepID=UPI001933370F|nr:hypothetical protein F1D61_32640 [Methylobacterium aquaticum]